MGPVSKPVTTGWWDRQADSTAEARQANTPAILSELAPIIGGAGRRFLEIGCGPGRLLFPMAAMAGPDVAVVGLDWSEKMLAHAWRRCLDEGYRNVSLVLGDGKNLPEHLGSFDGIWSVTVFQHCPLDVVVGYIRAAFDRLKPDGLLRFQFVEGTERADLLGQNHTTTEMTGWCRDAGLDVVTVDPCRVDPVWTWITARKP